MTTSANKPTVEDARKRLKFNEYASLLKIEDRRTGDLVPLELNSVQKKVRREIAIRLRDKVPVRLVILKSRRMGVSTVIQASFAHLAFTTPRFQCVTGAHEDESSQYLHGMTEQMYDHLPSGLKPPKKTGLRGRKIGFLTGAGMRTFTAGSRANALRGQGTRAIHCSEVAFWPDIQGTLVAARQIVPNEPGTMVILESTAFGRNQFHQEWLRAKSGLSDYTPLFYGWFEFDEYRMPLPPGGLLHVPAEPDWLVDEPALREMGCDDEQLAWRRRTIANECAGSLDQFHQEYPATDHEAFLASGRPFFKGLEKFHPVPPIRRGWFVGDPVPGTKYPGKLPITFVPDEGGLAKIWDVPEPGTRYAIWADVAGSVILDEYEARMKVKSGTGTDAYAAYVISLKTGKIVAGLHGRVADEKVWAWELARIGRIYACDGMPALIAVEKQGGYGVATNIYLRDELKYPNLWRDLDFDSEDKRDEALAIGWQTSVTTRPQMLAELDAVLREDPARLVDDGLKDEMSAFVYNTKGKPEADAGYHDDRVMAAAGCARIFQLRAQPLGGASKPQPAQKSIIDRAPRIDRSRLN